MKTDRRLAVLATCVCAFVAMPAEAIERIRGGQWVGNWTGAGRTVATSNCMTQSDADALNGDVKSVRAYLEKVIPPSICKLTDVKVNGAQVVYTCGANEVTTTYHGDRFESVDTKGSKSEAKLVGACK